MRGITARSLFTQLHGAASQVESPFTRVPSQDRYGSVTEANSRASDCCSISNLREAGVRPLKVSSRSSEGTTSTQFCPEPLVR